VDSNQVKSFCVAYNESGQDAKVYEDESDSQ